MSTTTADTPIDVAAVRTRFPALLAHPDRVFACAPGGTQVLGSALDALREAAIHRNANQHGPFLTSREVDSLHDDAREELGRFLGSTADSIVFGPNMTTLAFHLSHALDEVLATGGEIVCTRLDHDANVAPWVGLAERCGATVRWIDITEEAMLDIGAIADVVTERTRLVTFPLASNAFGSLVDPAPIVAAARAVGALTIADAVHAAPHVPIDRLGMGIDVVFCSPYKFFGPHAGVMAADPALLERLTPDKVRPSPAHGPEAWQTGTAAMETIAASAEAARYMVDDIGSANLVSHERTLSARFLDGLAGRPDWTLHGTTDPSLRTPTFAITHQTLTPAEVGDRLDRCGVNVYTGHYYAIEPMTALGLLDKGGATRIGFAHYHGPGDIDRVLAALDELS